MISNFPKYILFAICFTVSNIANADCFEYAGKDSNIDPDLLRAIAKVESNLNPHAIGKNPVKGFGMGLMQIDSQHFNHLRKFDIYPEMLFNECLNIYVGAYFLKISLNRMGHTWDGVGAYNAGFSKKIRQVKRRKDYARKVQLHYHVFKKKHNS
ncbi:transglycosylase SLT domain-containing protein [Escherichia coli]|uniref:transglycosylase SLT domain-containing protein n=1 Tax=Escherichia coli TaxID=562 RepID=UPI0038B337FC